MSDPMFIRPTLSPPRRREAAPPRSTRRGAAAAPSPRAVQTVRIAAAVAVGSALVSVFANLKRGAERST